MKWSEMSTEERNRLVAEKVMGTLQCLDKRAWQKGPVQVAQGWQCLSCGAWGTGMAPGQHDKPDEMIPHYTTDINAAWQIVEAGKFHSVELECYLPKNTEQALYRCFILVVAEGQPYKQYASKTAQEAICLASLKACGVRVEP